MHALHPSGVPPTRPPSPGATASANAGLAGSDPLAAINPFEQLGGMESEIFTGLDSLVQDLARDNLYWHVPSLAFLLASLADDSSPSRDSLNSAQTNSSWAWLDSMLLQPPQDGASGANGPTGAS